MASPEKAVRPKCKSESSESIGIVEYSGSYKTAGEYADALQAWMMQVYQLQCISASFPFFLASVQRQNQQSQSRPTTAPRPSGSAENGPQPRTPNPQQADTQNQQRRTNPALSRRGIEYMIPSIWKRITAESIDFVLLFAIKLGVTYAAVDTFNLLEDVEKYDLETLSTEFLNDYKVALNMTSEILFLELLHRLGTCAFEALCLHRGPQGMGGATPGKRIMGLKVVKCEWVAPTTLSQAIIFPSGDLGLGRALLRSLIKNFLLTFLFPICFTLFSFQHSRTVYDIISGSMVVEVRAVPAANNNNNNNVGNNNVNAPN